MNNEELDVVLDALTMADLLFKNEFREAMTMTRRLYLGLEAIGMFATKPEIKVIRELGGVVYVTVMVKNNGQCAIELFNFSMTGIEVERIDHHNGTGEWEEVVIKVPMRPCSTNDIYKVMVTDMSDLENPVQSLASDPWYYSPDCGYVGDEEHEVEHSASCIKDILLIFSRVITFIQSLPDFPNDSRLLAETHSKLVNVIRHIHAV